INSEPDFNKLVLMITNMANEVTEASSTWLEILDEKRDKLYIASSKKLTSNEIKTAKLSTSEGLSGRIFKEKKAKIINEIAKDPEFNYIKTWKTGVNSLLAVPLITTKNKIMGIIFVAKNFEFGFEPDDLAMLQAFSNQVVIAIENSKLLKDSIQRERLEQELKIAKEVQQKLLPQNIPLIKGFDISAISFTANEVGGDYYDFISYDKNNFGIVVADVSGKGTSAAFYMAEMKGIIKSLSSIYKAPKDLFSHTNEILFEQLEKKAFITASLVSVDIRKKDIRYIRAGHCPLIYYSAESNELDYKTPKGIGLGLCNKKLFDMNLEEEQFKLKSGDVIVIFSDGLDEARNIFDEEYGDAKIGQLLVKNKDLGADDIKHAILDDIVAFTGKAPMHDDMTLAVIKVL
ncbi:MAG: SpoIIE family protein phosphatase, partial [Calditrichaeota bacterium]|nr:SpoIIE family protein phosphatase [Calditrichota bacterium]